MERNLSVELRPESLDDFIGCGKIIEPIKEGIKQGRVDSTYVLTGPPGTGKTSLARAIVKYVNGKLDYYDIDEPDTSDLSADSLRILIERARISPAWGDYKGIILDEAHKLSTSAMTIVLKAIEEPCASTIWLVCSSEPSKLPEAIRRRGSFYVLEGLNPVQTELLVLRAIDYVGGAVAEKYRHSSAELTKELVSHDVTSPGLIVRAVEKFITGVPSSEAAQVSEVTTVDTLEVSRGAARGDWSAVQKLLQNAPRSAARDIRSAVSGYFRSILVKESAGSPRAQRCVWAIQQMAELANQNQFEDGLIWAATCASLYNICVGQKDYITKKG